MRHFRPWTTEEIQYLKKNYKKLSIPVISKVISRSNKSVYWKAGELKIKGKGRMKSIKKCKPIKLKKVELGYVAGIIDGEGSIGLYHECRCGYDNFHPFISITNVDKKMLEYIQKKIGFGHVRLHVKSENKNHSTTYRYCIENIIQSYIFCITLEPYLITKKRQAKDMIKYCKIKERIINKKISKKKGKVLLKNIATNVKKLNFQCNALRLKKLEWLKS